MRCRQCGFDPCACGSEDYEVEEAWVVVCLGVEPLVFGVYGSELEAEENLERHCPASEDHPAGICPNGINADEHHVMEVKEA